MGNKVFVETKAGEMVALTGRQFKAMSLTGQKSQGSNLLLSLMKRI